MMNLAPLTIAATLALTLVQAPGPESVADSTLEARTREVSAHLRCPVCQGLSIQDSPSPLAQEMRGVVRDQLRAGQTPEQVKKYFVERYGEWILLEPAARGFNLAVYLLPGVLLIAGAVLVVVLARRWSRQAALAPRTVVEEEPEFR